MESKILKQIAEHVKVSEDKVVETFNESIKFVNEQFANADDKTKQNKALLMTVNKFKTNLGGNTNNYKGIVLGVSGIQDSNNYQRRNQLELYNSTLKKAEESGDSSIVDELISKVVNLDNEGNPIPLFPFLKNNGEKSAMAGKVIPNEEESQIRNVVGMAYVEGQNAEEDLRPFSLTIRGKALNNIPSFGKIVSFKAGGKIYNESYQLNSSVTDFVETEDVYLQEGLDNVGLDSMIEKIFINKIVTYETIEKWVEEFKENPNESPIPKELKYSYVVINNCNCITQNFEPNEKGKVSMTFCSDEFSMNDQVTLITGTTPEIAEKIEFTSNSTCSVIGQLSIFGTDEPMVYVTLFGAIGKKGMFIPRVFDAKPLPETTEEVKSEPVKEVKEETEVKKAW